MGEVVRWPKHIRLIHDHSSDRDRELTCGYCLGGLFTCATCGASEGELPTDCPGYQLTLFLRDQIYAMERDWRRREGWVCLEVRR